MISMDWHSSAEGETMLQHFYNPQTTGRKLFGVLEKPSCPSNIEEVSYKLFVVGRAAIGKTATVSRLAGNKSLSGYVETIGIRKTNIYWPAKIWDKVILFKLQFWDAGENSIKKYSHILPVCKDKADALVFIFSCSDESSFQEIPQLMNRFVRPGENPVPFVIGTRYNSSAGMELASTAIRDFELKWKIPVLKIDNNLAQDRNEVQQVAPILNVICERLWLRDQEMLLQQAPT
ncbi:ciliogenesis and planar polarity effector 2-like [Ischnura elegans]|uniref:ciliogenesis and planar polarity effector 2-like n=1 Tax=Ischnura elegans TaxID=197161 RepID=UPI001ED87E67|nr:ciliogenesis and planar polarity effector 2-like [Ischnura elegans]